MIKHVSTRKKTIMIGAIFILLLLISWIGNILYYNSMQLDKPVFPTFYKTTSIYKGNNILTIHFIENKGPGKKVQSIRMNEFDKEASDKLLRAEYKYQSIYEMNFDFTEKDLTYLQDQNSDLIVNELTVRYDDGTVEEVPIGELVFRADPVRSQEIVTFHGGSSSDGSGYEVLEMNTDAVLEKVELTQTDKLDHLFNLRLYGKPYDTVTYPKQVKKGNSLILQYTSSEPSLSRDGFISYSVLIRVHFRLSDGTKIVYDIQTYNHFINSSEEIKTIVHNGGSAR